MVPRTRLRAAKANSEQEKGFGVAFAKLPRKPRSKNHRGHRALWWQTHLSRFSPAVPVTSERFLSSYIPKAALTQKVNRTEHFENHLSLHKQHLICISPFSRFKSLSLTNFLLKMQRTHLFHLDLSASHLGAISQ